MRKINNEQDRNQSEIQVKIRSSRFWFTSVNCLKPLSTIVNTAMILCLSFLLA